MGLTTNTASYFQIIFHLPTIPKHFQRKVSNCSFSIAFSRARVLPNFFPPIILLGSIRIRKSINSFSCRLPLKFFRLLHPARLISTKAPYDDIPFFFSNQDLDSTKKAYCLSSQPHFVSRLNHARLRFKCKFIVHDSLASPYRALFARYFSSIQGHKIKVPMSYACAALFSLCHRQFKSPMTASKKW